MAALLNADDFRRRARRVLPRGLFEYIDRGTEDELALRRLRSSLDAVTLTPSVLTGHRARSMATTLFSRDLSAPLVVAPTALAGIVSHDGEARLARAAAAVGIPFCVSTQSVTTIETIRAGAPDAELWFQLYVWQDRALTDRLLDRVAAAGCDCLVLTADTAVTPNREYNRRNGFSVPFQPSLRSVVDGLLHPRWLVGVFGRTWWGGGIPTYGHYPDAYRSSVTRPAMADAVRLDGSIDWSDVARLRDRWQGRLIVKGVLSVEDALKAITAGADGIVVSAHGGRNLDCLPSPADCLQEIAEACAGRIAVLADSGVRRGTDVLKYLALGAAAVQVGRLPLWGLAAGGEAGAVAILRLLLQEMDTAMGLLGIREPRELPGRVRRQSTAGGGGPTL